MMVCLILPDICRDLLEKTAKSTF